MVGAALYDAAMPLHAHAGVSPLSYPWHILMQRWSDLWLGPDRGEAERRFSDLAHQERWLGCEGAAAAQIDEAERRLGTVLPPSYRQFLAVSDGWSHVDDFMGPLLSTAEVGWLKDLDPEFVAIWGEDDPDVPPVTDDEYFVYGDENDCVNLRREYFHTALKITEWGDGAMFLLNPAVVDENGEWEAWSFANWYPGAYRHRSFWELMVDTIKGDYPDADWSAPLLAPIPAAAGIVATSESRSPGSASPRAGPPLVLLDNRDAKPPPQVGL